MMGFSRQLKKGEKGEKGEKLPRIHASGA